MTERASLTSLPLHFFISEVRGLKQTAAVFLSSSSGSKESRESHFLKSWHKFGALRLGNKA